MIKRNAALLVFLPVFALILGVFLYLAESPEELYRGLGGVDNLEEAGMLFVFEKSDYHEIWMRNMKFPIDIL